MGASPKATLILDLETLGTAGSLPAVAEMARAADKDPATFAALSPALAHVVCVGLKHLETGREMALVDLKPFGEDAAPFGEQMQGFGCEADLLRRANELLGKAAALVTFNGRAFDVPVLVHRMVAHEIAPCAFLLRCARQPRYKGAEPHCDLREQFQGASNGAGTSLRAFALGYGLEDPKAGGDGAHVGDLVAEGKGRRGGALLPWRRAHHGRALRALGVSRGGGVMADPRELLELADLIPIEVEDPDAFTWPEDAQTDAERAYHLAEVLPCHLELPADAVEAYRAWLLAVAERLDRMEHAL